ncbi:MAG: hypothetical protein LC130_24950 [Bryobacterales bacterium]|nr:hypothetical protein [Bryobacterales bacterium]MEB2361937.1 hypothetical protein [Bryobacterales bacterium]
MNHQDAGQLARRFRRPHQTPAEAAVALWRVHRLVAGLAPPVVLGDLLRPRVIGGRLSHNAIAVTPPVANFCAPSRNSRRPMSPWT